MSDAPFELPQPVERFSSSLLTWYAANRRTLPWRERPEPYAVWIAEIMLQQTTVKAALPYYERFLGRFPSVAALAEADEAEVLACWAGLGYYSRARNLLAAAKVIRDKHAGSIPNDYGALLALPGIGRYTAGAILSIAFGIARPVLDGNVARVFARYLGFREEWSSRSAARLWELLGTLVESPEVSARVADFNQALMELGATVCLPRQPACLSCPIGVSCIARRQGKQEEIPRKAPARPSVVVEFTVAVVRSTGRLLMRPTDLSPFPLGFWELPRVAGAPAAGLADRFHSDLRLRLSPGHELGLVTHCITRHRLRLHAVEARLRSRSLPDGFAWIEPEDGTVALSGYVKKVLRLREQ